jgi:hypothetical protein
MARGLDVIKQVWSLWVGVALLGISPANALTYDLVNDSSGTYEVSGFIETDGNFGVLTDGDIINWGLNVNVGSSNTVINGPQGVSDFAILGNDVTATSSGLFFNFGDPTAGLLEFLGFGGFVCFQNQDACLSSNAYADSTLLLDVFGDPTDALGPISESGNVEFAIAETPLPAALPLFAGGGLGVMGLLGWRRKRKVAAIAA